MTKHRVYYATHPIVVWQNRHKIRLWRHFTHWSIQKSGLQKRSALTHYSARFYPSTLDSFYIEGETIVICVEYVPSDMENIFGVRSVEFLRSRLPLCKIDSSV